MGQSLPPPAAAHPAPLNAPPRPFFPLLRGAGRGPNGGKQIICKHFPYKKKKKKKVHTHTQMPPQVETHTIFELMEEASSGQNLTGGPIGQHGYYIYSSPFMIFTFTCS